jgi:hypothetical protein
MTFRSGLLGKLRSFYTKLRTSIVRASQYQRNSIRYVPVIFQIESCNRLTGPLLNRKLLRRLG